jgi:6-pyruvoyl-tetrahydropterin synthase-like protein
VHITGEGGGTVTRNTLYSTNLTHCYFHIFLLSILALVAIWPLTNIDWFISHEYFNTVERVIALSHEVRSGDLYPRWLSTGYYGQGLPFINYYSPSYYLISAYLHALGIPLILSMKLVIWATFFLSGLGTYFWLRRHATPTGALIAAILYMYLPYHFVDLYVRGSLSELTALAVLPFLFLGIDTMFSRSAYKGVIVTAISSAGLVLSHNLSAFMAIPFAALYWVIMATHNRASIKDFAFSMLGPILGVFFSAFYWLPMIFEHNYIAPLSATMTDGYFNFSNHFVFIKQFFNQAWGFGLSQAGPKDGMSFQLGLVLTALIVTTILSLTHCNKRQVYFGFLTLSLGLIGLFMTTELSKGLYENIQPLKYVQFPWRFLGPSTLFLAAFCSLSDAALYQKFRAPLLITPMVLAIIYFSIDQRAISREITINSDNIFQQILEQQKIGSLVNNNEYLPIWAKGNVTKSRHPIPLNAATHITNIKINTSKMSFTYSHQESAKVVIPWHYYPGWKATVDGKNAAIGATNEGFILLLLPEGKHFVSINFGSTPARRLSWSISCIGVLLSILLFLKGRKTFSSKTKPYSEL